MAVNGQDVEEEEDGGKEDGRDYADDVDVEEEDEMKAGERFLPLEIQIAAGSWSLSG